MAIRVQPSILSADFVNLERDLGTIESADGIHVDVMDGHFVPNLTFGTAMVQRLQEVSKLPLDVHLMLEEADTWAPKYSECGVFSVTFHLEASKHPKQTAQAIRASGSRAGLAIKPGTPWSEIENLVEHFDQILVMSVEPGFGGQKFLTSALTKLTALRNHIDTRNLDSWLQVDGGITLETIGAAAAAGADTFVAGSSVFSALDRNKMIAELRASAQASLRD
jgi:ribulose-phosphate 3-epimerase